MKSKNSFFNMTVFKKNATLYWPIWVVYTIILACFYPVVMWMNFNYSRIFSAYTEAQKLADLINNLYTVPAIVLIAITSIVLGMALYGYLYNNKSANMIHSLPVDRKQLFGTNLISGLTFLIVPLFVMAASMSIIALCYGVPGIETIWFWFLLMAGTAFTAFSIVTFCAMFTGHMAMLPVFVVILNYLPMWAYYMVYVVIISFGYGVSNIGYGIEYVINYLTPYNCFYDRVFIGTAWDKPEICTGAIVNGEWIVVIYSIVSVLLLVIAYITYQKRQIEQVGNFITVNWLKAVFRWGAGMTTGIFFTIFIKIFFEEVGIKIGFFMFLLLMIFFGLVGYFAAEMFVRKSFKVWKKKNFINSAIFSVVLLLSFFGLYGVSNVYEDYIPEKDEVVEATLGLGYEITFTGEEVEKIIQVHEEILKNKEICENARLNNREYTYVSIHYTLENGNYIRRQYQIPTDADEMVAAIDKMIDLESDVENFLVYLFCQNYEDVTDFGVSCFCSHDKNEVYQEVELKEEQIKELYKAMIADAKAGTLAKYNVYDAGFSMRDEYVNSEAYIRLEFVNPNREKNESGNGEDDTLDSHWLYANVHFGPDCENIVNKLIELEIIESVDDITWDL